ncbi:MAG TPA: DUF885 domain-containing protein [Terracidiphilus sp.]|nr:DUF885 domain-containing protein [Terracidiphilus sp.]
MKKLLYSALSAIVLLSLFVAPGAAAAQKLTVATRPATPPSLDQRRAALNDLFGQYWDANLQHNPEFASTIGDKRFNDKLFDFSVEAYNAWLAQEQNFLMRLATIDTTGFTDQEKLSRDLLMRHFTQDLEAADYKEWEMPVNQLGGIYSRYPELAAQLSFTTVKDYDDWIARLRAMPHAFDQVTDNMAIGMEDHRVPPKYLLEKTLPQVELLANAKPEDSPLAAPLKHFPASIPAADQDRIKAEMLDVIAKKDLPAYKQFARFLRVSYIPAGRPQPGIDSIPGGDKYYQFLVERETTTHMTPAEIHQIGLEQVQQDEAAMLAIAQKLGFKDLKSFQESIKTNPKLHPASAEALLDAYRSYLKPMEAKLPQLFGHLPKTPFEVVAVPPYLEKNAPTAYYQPGTADGSRPGRLTIDTYNAQDRNLCDVEDIAYHEGLPGHHLQVSLQQEMTNLPAFRRYQMYGAYTEGWALYAEQLGKDVGFYQDPYEDYGRLQGDMWRAIRLVVDTGVHSQHWTRQQMVDYFHAHSSIDETDVQAEVDRYIAWPGQALSYKIGQLTILALRDKAKKELGPGFDLRAFNDEVLSAGSIPLDMLTDRVEAWITTQKAAQK